MKKSMRENKTFGDKKLTRQEFSKKYWLDGDAPDQYHTAEIEDGRDEREQFLINNDRALFKMFRENRELIHEKYKQAEENCYKTFRFAILIELILTIFLLSRKR